MPPPRVCVVGSSNLDLTFRTSRLPRPGETFIGRDFRTDFGGKGANQAVAAARLGAAVSFVSKLGRDAFGEQVLRHFRQEGIDTAYVLTDERRPTGVAGILVDDDAHNCIVVVPGANHGLTPEDVRGAAEVIRAARVLVCQLEVLLETALEAFRIAAAAGVRTLLNPAPAEPLPEELLRLTDLCVPNESETEALTGRPVGSLDEVTAAARILLDRGPREVIVTLGGRGALLVSAESVEPVPAYRVEAVDSTGAGDAFLGALAVCLAEGGELRAAVRRAGAVAALSVTRHGAQSSFPTRAEVEAFEQGAARLQAPG
jgi:ribokinase